MGTPVATYLIFITKEACFNAESDGEKLESIGQVVRFPVSGLPLIK